MPALKPAYPGMDSFAVSRIKQAESALNKYKDQFLEKPAVKFVFGPNFWRDTPVRYLGYFNELASNWSSVIKKIILNRSEDMLLLDSSRGIAALYTTASTLHDAWSSYELSKGSSKKARGVFAAAIAGDTLLFQLFATYILPFSTSELAKKLAEKWLERISEESRFLPMGGKLRLILPAVAGTIGILCSAPLDGFVQKCIRSLYWPHVNQYLKQLGAPTLYDEDVMVIPLNGQIITRRLSKSKGPSHKEEEDEHD